MTSMLKDIKKQMSFINPGQMYSRRRPIIYLAIVFLFIYFITYYILPSNMSFKENFDMFNRNSTPDAMTSDNSTKLVYFYMNGCGHCKNFTPIWDEFCSANSTTIKTYKFEQSQAQEQIRSYNISGFPSILLLDENNSKIDEYNGARTVEALKNYVNNHAK
jgi:thiol-disulfide isomerase/thioredoxin